MRRRLAALCFAFTAIAIGFGAGLAQASFAPVEQGRIIRDDVINRDIVAETHLYCLALAVYFEGGSTGETEEGQRHIARVVVKRARANRKIWGGSDICDVVFYQRGKTCQFSFACLPLAKRTVRGGASWRYSVSIARDELEGRSTIDEQFTRYYMNAALTPDRNVCRFRKEFVPVLQAGRHEFFREPTTSERLELAKTEPLECKRHAESLKRQAQALKKKKSAKTKPAVAVAQKKQPAKKVKYAKR